MEGAAVDSASRPVLEQNGEIMNGQEKPKTNGDMNGVSNHVSSDKSGDVKKEHKHSSDHKHHSSSKHKSSHSDKHRHSSSHKSSHSDKDKHRHSSSDKHKHHSSSDKHKSSHSSKDRDKDKHHSSSSSHSKDRHSSSSKHHSSSHKDKSHSSSSSGEKSKHSSDRHDKHKHSSSSSSDKHRSEKHEKSKHDKDRHSSDNHKHSSSEKKPEVKMEVDKVEVKAEPVTPVKAIKEEPQVMDAESDDDIPLAARKEIAKKEIKQEPKRSMEDDSDDEPLAARMEKSKAKKVKTESPAQKVPKRKSMEEDDDYKPDAKKKKKEKIKKEKAVKVEKTETVSPKKGKVKKEEKQEEKWKWWEETPKEDGVKWTFLEHKGVVFAPPYERLPSDVKFYYNGAQVKLSDEAEEVAGFYAKMLDHDYTTRDVFNKNFFKDWRSVMKKEEKELITDLKKCNFKDMYRYFKEKQEERKNMSKEEKKKIKEQNEAIMQEHGYCMMDGHKEKMGNFKIEPPGLFRGRGDHPKQGCLKRRVEAEDIIINCSKDSKIPEAPPGHKWKKVQHDNSVTWLASWQENVQNQIKYVMLAATSKLKGEKDFNKYETARRLHKIADRIRAQYREDWKSKEMRLRQRSVALYFIDKLALRAGNEKDEDSADTVGCCSLRYEHIKLHEEKDGKEHVVEFDFLGKDSIRYHNEVAVEKRVFKNLQLFMENKSDGDDLFDRLNTTIMNKHLNTLMDGLTAKVFRTYNASRTLQEQLDLLTKEDDPIPAKILAYNRANRAVAILCNHQRSVSKNFSKQMENLQNKIEAKKDAIAAAKTEVKQAKSDYKALKTEAKRKVVEKKKKAVERLEQQLEKLEISMTDKDENKEIALGTSKLNYLDPRISVAWCKKWDVPIEKVYNKTQRDKFAWAIDMAEADYKFTEMEEED